MKNRLIILLLLIFSCSSEEIIKEKKIVKNYSYYRQNYFGISNSKDEEKILEFLNEIKQSKIPETAILTIPYLFSENVEVKKLAYKTLDSYRRFTVYNMDIYFYDYLDSWFRSKPKMIIDQMGLKNKYSKFLKERKLEGKSNDYYKENPLRYVLKNYLYEYISTFEELNSIQQFWTLWITGNMKLDQEIDWIIKILKNKQVIGNDLSDIRFSAVWALNHFNNRRHHKIFAQHLKSDNPYLQEMIAYSVSRLRDQRFKDIFLKMLVSKDKWISNKLKSSIIWGLHKMNTDNLDSILLNPHYQELDVFIEAQRLWAIHQLENSSVDKIILNSLKSEYDLIRNLAIVCIKSRDKESFIPTLYPFLKGEDVEIKRSILEMVKKYKRKDAVEFIIPLLDEQNHEFKKEVVNILAELKSKKATGALVENLNSNSEDLEIKALIVKALIKIKDKSVFPVVSNFYRKNIFIEFKKGEDTEEKKKIREKKEKLKAFPKYTRVLSQLANRDQLFEQFESRHSEIIVNAVKAVPYFRKEIKDYRFLDNLLETGDKDIQVAAILIMGQLEYIENFELLKKIIKNKKLKKEIRMASILSLARLKQEKTYDFILEKIGSTDIQIRQSSILALALLGDQKGKSVLNELWEKTSNAKQKAIIIFAFVLFGDKDSNIIDSFGPLFSKKSAVIAGIKGEFFKYLTNNEINTIYKQLKPKIDQSNLKVFNSMVSM